MRYKWNPVWGDIRSLASGRQRGDFVIYNPVPIKQSLGLAIGLGLLLVLLGGFIMAFNYGTISDCINLAPSSPSATCWDPHRVGALTFYGGTVVTILGTMVIAGPSVARLVGRLRGTWIRCRRVVRVFAVYC